MRKLLLVATLLPALAGAAAGGAWWWWRPPPPVEPAEGAGLDHPGPVLALDELAVPVQGPDGEVRLVLLKARLELSDAIPPDLARAFLPRLQDASLTTMGSLVARGAFDPPGQRLAVAKRALRYAAERVLGRGMVRDVLIERNWEQPLR